MQKAIGDTLRRQQSFWISHARPNYKHSLEHLFEDLKRLVEKEYSAYANSGEEDILTDERILDPLIEDILPPINLYDIPLEPDHRLTIRKRSLSVQPKVLQ